MRVFSVLLASCLACGTPRTDIDVVLPWDFPETDGLRTPIARLQPVVFSIQRGGVTLWGDVESVKGWLDVWDPDGRLVPVDQLDDVGMFRVHFRRTGRHVIEGRAGPERTPQLVVEVVEAKGIRLARSPRLLKTVAGSTCERSLVEGAPQPPLFSNQRLGVPLVLVDADDRPLLGLMVTPIPKTAPTANLWQVEPPQQGPVTWTFTEPITSSTVSVTVERDDRVAFCGGG